MSDATAGLPGLRKGLLTAQDTGSRIRENSEVIPIFKAPVVCPAHLFWLTPMSRTASIARNTAETQIEVSLDLDGSGRSEISTGVGFFDHMLTLFARHGLFDLNVKATGDLHVDHHHTVEDVGICIGRCLSQALGDKHGMTRYGHMTLPMEETLVTSAVDLSGRMAFVYRVDFPTEKIGEFDTQLVQEFWTAVSSNALMNLHLLLHHGTNSHHISEAVFKATARALRMAVAIDPRQQGVPSSKGTLHG
jgi:imidazoleglycerol-phosphate dehydratase